MNRVAPPYLNAGNPLVLSMVPRGVRRVLDIGCGGGNNAQHLRAVFPGIEVVGLTHSATEAAIATPNLDAVHVIDLESGLTDAAVAEWGAPFDMLLLSHVLEHLVDPVTVLKRCLSKLKIGGHVLIVVPNVLEWRTRMQFLRGRFIYADHGIMDRTHMRFFTFDSAPNELIAPITGLELLERRGRGSIPLGPLRRLGAARRLCAALDRAGTAWRPNFCCGETALLARWHGQSTL
ncbi:MAG: methylase [Rhodobacter sp. CACIA14H1]|nr:MAG: methylase [Rhodobacter sp. CACIA14H1]